MLLAALREIYDGSWTRHVGTDGGRTLAWSGKVGFIGAVTPTIDRHHAVMGAMGERFVLYRLPTTDPTTQARQALAHAGRERTMRRELAEVVSAFLNSLEDEPGPPLTAEDDDRQVQAGIEWAQDASQAHLRSAIDALNTKYGINVTAPDLR